MTFLQLFYKMQDIILKTAATDFSYLDKPVLCEGGCVGIDNIVEHDDCFILEKEAPDGHNDQN